MIKKIIWLIVMGAALAFVLPKIFQQLSLYIDPTNNDIKRVITEEDSGLLLSPEFDTLPTATNSATIVVHGFSQGAEEVELFINDISKKKLVITKTDGSFKISNAKLFEGKNMLTLVAYGKGGAKSEHSDPVVVLYKKGTPKLTVNEPEDGFEKKSDDNTVQIAGVADTDAEVTINGRWIRLSSDGSFSHKFRLSDGENLIEIVATDEAGNQKAKTLTIKYSKD